MTLADFARQHGINPATARQWRRRGKIIETPAGFALRAPDRAAHLEIGARDGVTGERDGRAVTPGRDNVTGGRDGLRAENETLRGLVRHWQARHDAARDEIDTLRATVAQLQARILELTQAHTPDRDAEFRPLRRDSLSAPMGHRSFLLCPPLRVSSKGLPAKRFPVSFVF